MFRWSSKDKLHGLCFCLLLTVKEQRALEQATGPERALLSVLITASHLSHRPALSEAEEVLGRIRRIILSEADISPTISCSVPPSFTLFTAFLPLELLWKIWKAPWWEMLGFSWQVTGFNTFFSCLCRDGVVPQKDKVWSSGVCTTWLWTRELHCPKLYVYCFSFTGYECLWYYLPENTAHCVKFHMGTAVLGESLWPGWDEKILGKISLVLEGLPTSIWWEQIYTNSLLPLSAPSQPLFKISFISLQARR